MDTIFKIIYFAGIVIETIIRAPYRQRTRQSRLAKNRFSTHEKIALFLVLLEMFLLPAVYALTPWLDFADYHLPLWAGWLGAPFLASALLVFWRAHHDLGRHWSATLQLYEEHRLISSGIYGTIRHPMYASQWLWCLAQALLIQNWIAGFGGLVLFAVFYLIRVPEEEKLMLEQFGSDYREYMSRTGRVIPKVG